MLKSKQKILVFLFCFSVIGKFSPCESPDSHTVKKCGRGAEWKEVTKYNTNIIPEKRVYEVRNCTRTCSSKF